MAYLLSRDGVTVWEMRGDGYRRLAAQEALDVRADLAREEAARTSQNAAVADAVEQLEARRSP